MRFVLVTTLLLAALSSFAATPQPYHLELEANPAAPFPYLGKFGTVELHVYRGGVRAEALWLNAMSRNSAPSVIVANPLGRVYVDVPLRDIAGIVTKLSGGTAGVERLAKPYLDSTMRGKVKGIDATRYRLMYGANAWIDLWTTTALPDNPQLRAIADQLVRGVSPATADVAKRIPGLPLYIELNFRRFQKLPLLTVKKLTMSADDEEDALTLGKLWVRNEVLEKLWE
jgi:hypothetical protein